MRRRFTGYCLLLALCSCGSGKDLVLEDLPPHPSERVERAEPPPVVEDVQPPVPKQPAVGQEDPGMGGAVEGVNADLVQAWKASRSPGVVFQQDMGMNTGAQGARTVRSKVQILGDQSRRDDMAADGTLLQTTLTLPDDAVIIDHATRTWTSLGGRLDQIAKDASAWYFQKDFKGLKNWTRVGEEVVDGVLCEVFEKGKSTDTAGGQVRRSEKVWFARDLDGFVLRYESSSFLGLGVTVTRSQVRKAAVSSKDLQVPAGYTRQAPGR